ncbi:MAG: hypothetical protein HKUEN01_09090 [Candidatus Kuenenia stuttgartiensis]|nr:MAG: hypothetical protein HKUEN01_09090 [Candidatus Kuenenia stuttgartiensis]
MQSTDKFHEALKEMNHSGDLDRQIQFLIYCDIPVIEAEQPFARRARPPLDRNKEMRNIGERNLKHFVDLHEATIDFINRHFGKLKKHIKNGTIKGIPNFMHIFLAICWILENQIERVIQGFKSKLTPMTSKEWYDYREQLDEYFKYFKEVMDCLWGDYLTTMLKHHTRREIREKLDPDFHYLKDVCSQMLGFRSRIEVLRKSQLKVQRESGRALVLPEYFESILKEEKWHIYCEHINSSIVQIRALVENNSIVPKNQVLSTNFQEIKTGRSIGCEYQIKEAQQSTLQCIEAIKELYNSSNSKALKQFLTFCDIPVIKNIQPILAYSPRPSSGLSKETWRLGEWNLRHFINHHKATLHFIDKHFRKLEIHIKDIPKENIPNFMHIFLAIGWILRNQIEMAIHCLKTKITPMSLEEWQEYLKQLDMYFKKFRLLMDCLWYKYLSIMLKYYAHETIRERFEPDFQFLKDICSHMLGFRPRIDILCKSHLKIQRSDGTIILPEYFSSVFNEKDWKYYSNNIKKIHRAIFKHFFKKKHKL